MTQRFVFTVHELQNTPAVVDAPLPADYIRELLHDHEASPFSEEPGHLEVRLSMSGQDVIVHGRIKMAMALPCARCLKPARFDVDSQISLMLSPGKPQPRVPASSSKDKDAVAGSTKTGKNRGKTADKGAARPEKAAGKAHWSQQEAADGYEFADAEAEIDTYSGDEVALDPFVREWIILETPIFPLCSEECPGIRPDPVAHQAPVESDQVLDPRLRPLLEIQKKKL